MIWGHVSPDALVSPTAGCLIKAEPSRVGADVSWREIKQQTAAVKSVQKCLDSHVHWNAPCSCSCSLSAQQTSVTAYLWTTSCLSFSSLLWISKCFNHFRTISINVSTLGLASHATKEGLVISLFSPYRCLGHYWSSEGSWEVVQTDPRVHGDF